MVAEVKQSRPPTKTSPPSSNDGMPDSVIARIRKPSGELKRLAACVYGRGGVGKTTLLGTMPGRGLVIDVPQVEGGTSVLADKADQIDILPIVRWEELDAAYKFLRHQEHEYKWVALDTITACAELAKRKSLRERDLAADPHQITMQDWGKIGQLVSELIYSFRLLPIHVIFLAQEKAREIDGVREYQPALSPMALDALLPSLHLVGRMHMYENDDGAWERRLRVGPHTMFLTKVRAVPGRDLPPVILKPNLTQILAYLMGHEKVQRPTAGVDESSILALEGDED